MAILYIQWFTWRFSSKFQNYAENEIKSMFFFQNGDARQASLSKLHGFFPKIVIILLIITNLTWIKTRCFVWSAGYLVSSLVTLVSIWSGQQSAVPQEKVSILVRPHLVMYEGCLEITETITIFSKRLNLIQNNQIVIKCYIYRFLGWIISLLSLMVMIQ